MFDARTWALRWTDRTTHAFAVCDGSCSAVAPAGLLMRALTRFYLPWVIGYYCCVFILLRDFLATRRFQTLYDRVTSQGPASRALLACFKLTGARHELAKRALYMATHLVFGCVTMAIAILMWYSFIAHTAFVFAIGAASVWNASSFYFSVFARKYESSVEEIVRRQSMQR